MIESSPRRSWRVVAVAVGAAYFVVGWVAGTLAGSVAGSRSRLAAWAICGVIFVAQIAYERVGLRNHSSTTSFHAAGAAGVGGFLLALAATINKSLHGGADARYLLAFVIWPLIVAVPAFAAALIVSALIPPRSER